MTTSSHEPKRFDCPDCGHHHKADMHEMVGHPEIHGKVPCVGCGKMLWLSLDGDGGPVVELYEEHLHEQAHKDRIAAHQAKVAAERAAGDAKEAAGRGGPPAIVTVIVSALVAAIVAGFMGAGADDSAASDDGAAQAAVESLRNDLDDTRNAVDTVAPRLDGMQADLQQLADRMDALRAVTEQLAALEADRAKSPGEGSTEEALEAMKAELAAAVTAMRSAQVELGNRLEATYVTMRQLDLRLKKLEQD